MTVTAVVTYDGLPVSAGGAHGMRTRDPRAAFTTATAFVSERLSADGPSDVRFRIFSGGGDDEARLQEFALERLGGPASSQRAFRDWNVAATAVDDVITALATIAPGARTAHGGPVAVMAFDAVGTLRDPATGRAWSQDEGIEASAIDGYGRSLGTSAVRTTLGTSGSSMSLWLSFPADERLTTAATFVQSGLPFRLSAKHWRRWRPAKTGNGWLSSREASPLG